MSELEQLRADNAILRSMVREYQQGARAEARKHMRKHERRSLTTEIWRRLPTEAQAVLTAMGIISLAVAIVDVAVRLEAWWVMR